MRGKWRIAGLAGAAVICMGSIGASMVQRQSSEEPFALLRAMGRALKDSVHRIEKEEEIAGMILGQTVTAAQVEIKATMYQFAGAEHPLEDAWRAMEIEGFERQFASQHGLIPTEEEIQAFTREMREVMEADEDGILYEKELLGAMGMTVDYYWEVYKPRVESPVHLIKIKIADYCDKNALDWTQIVAEADILSEMTDQRLRRQYGCEEGAHEDCNL